MAARHEEAAQPRLVCEEAKVRWRGSYTGCGREWGRHRGAAQRGARAWWERVLCVIDGPRDGQASNARIPSFLKRGSSG